MSLGRAKINGAGLRVLLTIALRLLYNVQTMEDARARLERKRQSDMGTQAQVEEMLSWADCCDNATIATRHMIPMGVPVLSHRNAWKQEEPKCLTVLSRSGSFLRQNY